MTVAHDSALHYSNVNSIHHHFQKNLVTRRSLNSDLFWSINGSTRVDVTNDDPSFAVEFVDTRCKWSMLQIRCNGLFHNSQNKSLRLKQIIDNHQYSKLSNSWWYIGRSNLPQMVLLIL